MKAPALLAALLAALSIGCVTKREYEKLRNDRDALDSALNELKRYQPDLEAENRRLKNEVERLELLAGDRTRNTEDAAAKRREYEAKLAELQKRLESLGSGPTGSEDVEISQTAEGTVVRVQEGVLFDPGRKEIKAKGQEILSQLAAEIASSTYKIRVEGHTDSDPVVKSVKDFPYGNLQLAADRALEVAHFLTAKAPTKVDENRLYVAGYGPHKPRAIGNTAEAKRKNRRVDIVLLNAPEGSIHGPTEGQK